MISTFLSEGPSDNDVMQVVGEGGLHDQECIIEEPETLCVVEGGGGVPEIA